MTITFTFAARQDILEAYIWYENANGLGWVMNLPCALMTCGSESCVIPIPGNWHIRIIAVVWCDVSRMPCIIGLSKSKSLLWGYCIFDAILTQCVGD